MEVFTGLRPPGEARVLKAPPEEARTSSRPGCGGRSEDRGGATGKRRPAGPRGAGGGWHGTRSGRGFPGEGRFELRLGKSGGMGWAEGNRALGSG